MHSNASHDRRRQQVSANWNKACLVDRVGVPMPVRRGDAIVDAKGCHPDDSRHRSSESGQFCSAPTALVEPDRQAGRHSFERRAIGQLPGTPPSGAERAQSIVASWNCALAVKAPVQRRLIALTRLAEARAGAFTLEPAGDCDSAASDVAAASRGESKSVA